MTNHLQSMREQRSTAGGWPTLVSRAGAGVFVSAFLFAPSSASASGVEGTLRPRHEQQTNAGIVLQKREGKRAAEGILELRRISGFTWEQLARLFRVSRRAVHFWASGQPMSAEKEERLHQVLGFVDRIYRGDPEATRFALLTPLPGGRTPFDLMADGIVPKELPTPLFERESKALPRVVRRPERIAEWKPEDLVDSLRERVHAPEQLKASTRGRVRRERG